MSSEHSREVLRDIAMETADEGNVPGRPAVGGLLLAIAAVIALILIYVATTTAPFANGEEPSSHHDTWRNKMTARAVPTSRPTRSIIEA